MKNERSLDGLRGVAAFIVVIYHYLLGFYTSFYNGSITTSKSISLIDVKLASSPLNIIYNGNTCVCIFFVLSGYVLSYKFFKYNDENIIRSSAGRRYIRLMIPTLFSIMLSYIIMKCNLFYNYKASLITGSDWWLGSFFNFEPNIFEAIKQAVYGAFFKIDVSYNNVLWTMHYELIGSFFVFGIISIFGKFRNRSVIYIIAILISYNTYYLAFILGIIICDMHNSKDEFRINKRYIKVILLIAGLMFCSYPSGVDVKGTIYEYINLPQLEDSVAFWHIVGSFLLVILLLNSERLKVVFSSKIPLFLGKISFSMYLVHTAVLCSFSSFVFIKLSNKFSYNQSFIIMFIISFIIIIVAAYYMERYIDKGAVKISKKVYTKYFE